MARAALVILDHYLENTTHEKFSEGQSLWCSFNRDKAIGRSSHLPIKNTLPGAIVEVLKSDFDKLRIKNFSAACEKVCM